MRNLYNRLMKEYLPTKHNNWKEVETEFKKFISTPKKILFHPSCGADESPILYVNRMWNPYLADDGPDVIIRCDSFHFDPVCWKNTDLRTHLTASWYRVDAGSVRGSLFISRVELMGRELWIVEIFERLNEDLLRLFLDEGTEVRYLFSTCDGIMSGMGIWNDRVIPSLYYSHLFEELKVDCFISEYVDEYHLKRLEHDPQRATWEDNILYLAKQLKNRSVANAIRKRISGNLTSLIQFDKIILNRDSRTEFRNKGSFGPEIGMLIRKGLH